MTNDELIALCDLNYAEAMRELTRRAGGAVLDEGGLVFFAAPHPLPVLANGVMRTTNDASPDEVLGRARTFFGTRGRGFSVVVREHADADLHAAAEAAGLVVTSEAPGMVLAQALPEQAVPGGVGLVAVTTPEDVAAFASVMSDAYATYGMPPDVAPALLPSLEVLRAPHIVSYLARADGRPAAGAMVVVTHGVAGIYWVGTTPAARGKGLAELCTRAATNAGFALGARIAALQASDMGAPIYRRMGYVEVTRYPCLVHFEPPAS